MSNLKLPTLTYSSLSDLLGARGTRKLGYETYALRVDPDTIAVTHHYSTIVELTPNSLFITNAGWSSSTTRSRLHKALVDNRTGYLLRQKNYSQQLCQRGGSAHDYNDVVVIDGFRSATFTRNGTDWELNS